MSFISLSFFILVIVSGFLYFIFPKKYRWIVLLLASLLFYAYAGIIKLCMAFVAVITAYLVSGKIKKIYDDTETDKKEQKKKAKPLLITGVVILVAMLFGFKVIQNLLREMTAVVMGHTIGISILVPLGISYYTFSLIGYMADVYWRKTDAEKNILHLLLYTIYFPQIVEGPIPRHKKLGAQLIEGHDFDFQRICFGLQRVLWGFFKKMVIADRAAIFVNNVFKNHLSFGGIFYLAAVLLAAIQLYADFSGCMDIAIGISECFGINLDENFKRPFFSRSAAEFWRRWHITLGTWFKDYVYMPMVISPGLMKISKKVNEKHGRVAAKRIMTIIPLMTVWILTGLWHGTGLGYIIWGLYWGIIITFSTVCAAEIQKVNTRFHINTESTGWIRWQRIRTFLIFCGGRLLTAPGDLKVSAYMVKSFFRDFNPWIFFDNEIENAGLNIRNIWCLVVACLILFFVSVKQEKGENIREKVAAYPIVLRWITYFLLIMAIVVFGIWGPGYDSAAFAYAQY